MRREMDRRNLCLDHYRAEEWSTRDTLLDRQYTDSALYEREEDKEEKESWSEKHEKDRGRHSSMAYPRNIHSTD